MFKGLPVTPWSSLIPNEFSPKRKVNTANCVFHAILQPLQWHVYFHNIISFNSTQASRISIYTHMNLHHISQNKYWTPIMWRPLVPKYSQIKLNVRNSFTFLRRYSFYCNNSNIAHICSTQFCPYFLHQILSTLEEKYKIQPRFHFWP